MKKRTLLKVLLLGGIAMTSLSGCGENRNSREWIENKVSEVSRVYPTENLFDLFDEFPEGFKVYQVYTIEEDYKRFHIRVNLNASKNRKLSGTLEKVLIETEPYRESVIEKIDLTFTDDHLVFSDEEKARELWPFNRFLFQTLEINHLFLSSLDIKSKSYNSKNGAFDVEYFVQSQTINQYFHKNKDEQAILKLGSSLRNDDYYYSIIVRYNDGHYFRETVSN